ncbi:UDP-2,3-diacylglucosamine diphosphatase LpxI [Limibaculum sp. M0105]|uniref:UDP-2,3-diacylglucosamine diphosphatase LpxI n=1 Tax=Thermohalobaculum xanthum TaxID=2753746 RepID=A0A8J7M5I5_9RHOB|nr:UDP-2,3-diacylglucosamine diphosphatase LpxI [Thermohalobaculum xanthum]MBK0398824.1 UDP-2,3-diacylglucosamine diphosphatase LpxI [Thermohalobaculum xanthum]
MAGAAGSGGQAGPPGCLAIIAGRGTLPQRLAEARREAGLPYLLIVFPGCEETWMAAHPIERHEFERAGRLFSALRRAGVETVVFAGAMNRPRLRPWRVDWTALRLLGRALRLLARGDDAMLRGFGAVFEERGLRLISPAEILGDELTLPRGALGRHAPSAADLKDAARAAAIVTALGPVDVGQGAVVARGLCLAVEAIEGTDLMLARIAELPAERRRAAPPPSGVLWKAPKPGQDRRFDLPTIGPATVEGAARAGLRGIVGAAGEIHLLDPQATREAADRLGLFVFGALPSDLAEGG